MSNVPASNAPKAGFRTSSFFCVALAIILPFVLPVVASLALAHSDFTTDQKAEFMALVFGLCKTALTYLSPSLGIVYVIARGVVSTKKADGAAAATAADSAKTIATEAATATLDLARRQAAERQAAQAAR